MDSTGIFPLPSYLCVILIRSQHLAALQGQYKAMVELLGDRDIDIEKRDSDGRTALHHAVQANRADCVSLLIAHMANVNATDNLGKDDESTTLSENTDQLSGRTPLDYCATSELQRVLKQHGARSSGIPPSSEEKQSLTVPQR